MEVNDALVTAITQELLKRLGGCPSPAGKKPLVIAGDPSILGADALASLEGSYDIISHSGLEALFPDNAEVLVTKLSVQALVRLSDGDAGCTSEGAALLWALLRGKKPVIVEEGIEWRGFKDAMSPALAAKYASCERTVAAYGAVFTGESNVVKVLSGKACPAPVPAGLGAQAVSAAPSRGTGARKRVLSEVEVMRLCPLAAGEGQVIEIGLTDILTPLAADYVAKMRITVNRV
ncbi:MAG: hypothetical protein LBD08_02320 [Treponema sp.]|jgi:hypothetical protein|nr:hypothetical protein [Treponema sp.]